MSSLQTQNFERIVRPHTLLKVCYDPHDQSQRAPGRRLLSERRSALSRYYRIAYRTTRVACPATRLPLCMFASLFCARWRMFDLLCEREKLRGFSSPLVTADIGMLLRFTTWCEQRRQQKETGPPRFVATPDPGTVGLGDVGVARLWVQRPAALCYPLFVMPEQMIGTLWTNYAPVASKFSTHREVVSKLTFLATRYAYFKHNLSYAMFKAKQADRRDKFQRFYKTLMDVFERSHLRLFEELHFTVQRLLTHKEVPFSPDLVRYSNYTPMDRGGSFEQIKAARNLWWTRHALLRRQSLLDKRGISPFWRKPLNVESFFPTPS